MEDYIQIKLKTLVINIPSFTKELNDFLKTKLITILKNNENINKIEFESKFLIF
jgi:hypothetical protein